MPRSEEGLGALLVPWEKDKRRLLKEQDREGGREDREEEGDEAKADRLKRQVMKHLGAGQVSKAVGLISSFGLAPLEDPQVWEQVQSKYPARKQVIPTNIPKQCPVDNLRGLRDTLLALRRGKSPGAGGLRPEFLKALAEVFEPGQMALLEDFGLRYLRGDLPAWWYAVWP